jgi:hypothetical protein
MVNLFAVPLPSFPSAKAEDTSWRFLSCSSMEQAKNDILSTSYTFVKAYLA